MNSRIKGIIAACLLAAGIPLFAVDPAEVKMVTIEEAVALAMDNNISLASSAIDLRMKERDAKNAWNVFIPTVQATGTLARTNMGEVTVSGLVAVSPGNIQYVSVKSDLEENQRWSAIGGLSATLNLNLALFDGLKATRQNYESGRVTWEQAKQDTELSVRKAFYGILVQEESLRIAKDKLANSEERLKQTGINYRNGIVPELTLLQTQLSVETQKPSIKEAETGLEQQKNLFAFLLGLPVGTKIALSGSIDPAITGLDADALVAAHLGKSYDIQLLKLNGDMAQTQLGALRMQTFTPSVSISQSWSPMINPIDDDWLKKDNWTDSQGAFSLTLAFNLTNLLPFSANGNSIAAARDASQKIDLAMKMSLYNAELEIRNLVAKLEKTKSSISAMELNVSLAQKAYRLTEEGYRAGTIEYLDLKDAESSLLQAQIGVLSEKYAYLSTVLDLEKALNAKLDR